MALRGTVNLGSEGSWVLEGTQDRSQEEVQCWFWIRIARVPGHVILSRWKCSHL